MNHSGRVDRCESFGQPAGKSPHGGYIQPAAVSHGIGQRRAVHVASH